MNATSPHAPVVYPPFDPKLDLLIERVIKAPRTAVWHAWTDPASFAQWWIPAPALCRVAKMELMPGGALATISAGTSEPA